MNEKIESDDEEDEDIVFEKAREFLRIVQSRTSVSEKQKSAPVETQAPVVERKMVQFGVHKTKKLKSVKTDSIVLTPLQRRKLVRVKTPVTSFQKPPTSNGLSEKEKEESVQKMLEHIRRMPKQETYTPPSFDKDVSQCAEKSSCDVEFCYLTSEQELTTWKLLRSSPTNCNVFVGNLSYKVNESLLLVAFQPFIVEQQQQHLKVRIVIDAVSGVSKGYGFVQFPYRRAAELAMMCMQRFEIFQREMQLGWGQEEVKNILQPEDTVKKTDKIDGKKVGFVVFDSLFKPAPSGSTYEKRKTRWDVETSENEPIEKLQSARTQSNVANTTEILRKASSDKPIEWLTREQRAKMIEVVCQNLRKKGVKHHLGVFGTHFEADNSRLFVAFCQQLTLEELKSEFEKYGAVEIKINTDSTGLSKGSAIVQYVLSASAETALKRLHGKVLGSKPLAIKIAEPKRIHKTGRNMNSK